MSVSNVTVQSSLRGLLGVVLDFFVVGIDDIVIAGFGGCVGRTTFSLLRFVDRLTELHGDFHEGLGLRLDVLGVRLGRFRRGLQRGDRVGDRGAVGFGDLVAVILQRLLAGVDEAFGLVLGFDTFATLLVGFGVCFSVLDHLLDVGVG